ncbi:MAG TPA: DNA ligase [Accumulibacter sp.]|nr:DNA ligase [Accumulibacter sp.]HMW16323.1 DNA ligase [Accumulibacter sp.]HMY05467.1 DNA ligase [Accumulibacter sp.]HNC17102.1 DNA ligase [Accumulibacter sp.]HND81196.1 DNA ligase [Accumulibacter sp.]
MPRHWIVQTLAWSVLIGASMPLLAADAPPLLLAETEHGQADVGLYLVSEKLDGIRAFWDGQVLRTRQGNLIRAPSWFIERLPSDQALDGELWLGRGQFERLSSIVRRQTPDDASWRQVRYLIFEMPQAPGIFRQRLRAMHERITQLAVPWLQVVEQFSVASRQELDDKLRQIVREGGEGLMLHRADAPYTTGRSDALLKLKPWRDGEATVLGYRPGRGKFSGLVGALHVRTSDGADLFLGSGLSDADRRRPPPIGSTVSYRYRELTARGRPRFASYHRTVDLW